MDIEHLEVCPFDEASESRVRYEKRNQVLSVECPQCGHYDITKEAFEDLPGEEGRCPDIRRRIHRWLFETHGPGSYRVIAGRPLPEDQLRGAKLLTLQDARHLYEEPPSLLERIDRTISNLAARTTRLGADFSLQAHRWAFPTMDDDEAEAILGYLNEQGLVRQLGIEFSLTPEGIGRASQIRLGGGDSETAFVAAWFGDELNATREGIVGVIHSLGWDPIVINLVPHNDIIDLRIYDEIRRCRFMVADLTMNRQSVYYEIGFAHGLGKEVILTCRNDCFDDADDPAKQVHFDLNHRNILKWADESELQGKLRDHLYQTVGSRRAERRIGGEGR